METTLTIAMSVVDVMTIAESLDGRPTEADIWSRSRYMDCDREEVAAHLEMVYALSVLAKYQGVEIDEMYQKMMAVAL